MHTAPIFVFSILSLAAVGLSLLVIPATRMKMRDWHWLVIAIQFVLLLTPFWYFGSMLFGSPMVRTEALFVVPSSLTVVLFLIMARKCMKLLREESHQSEESH